MIYRSYFGLSDSEMDSKVGHAVSRLSDLFGFSQSVGTLVVILGFPTSSCFSWLRSSSSS